MHAYVRALKSLQNCLIISRKCPMHEFNVSYLSSTQQITYLSSLFFNFNLVQKYRDNRISMEYTRG
ncbi:hypothetical protein ES319_D06G220600v1 [Gossypium barbadense]|uniref:Uncharacterized protein n=2 Tax=Gossypium TaxID=3633 RepID=A0A5J5R854_GOSBA|nr:hypothetical protein ES319_D06G220600v1 [Gossypium barbadense]TYG66012.1 hypothetical protein ES288_D06G233300v1 [Gossypium darwinii]